MFTITVNDCLCQLYSLGKHFLKSTYHTANQKYRSFFWALVAFLVSNQSCIRKKGESPKKTRLTLKCFLGSTRLPEFTGFHYATFSILNWFFNSPAKKQAFKRTRLWFGQSLGIWQLLQRKSRVCWGISFTLLFWFILKLF